MNDTDTKINLVYDFIVEYIKENGFPPSVREICAKCSIKSTASVYYYLEKLNEMGLLKKSPFKKRAIQLNTAQQHISIPLLGTIAAGKPILAVENLEGYIPVSTDICKENSFALKIKGDSMIEAGIFNNDIVIIEKTETAENGDIIVALIDDEATVKRFYKKNDKIILHPENSSMTDMVFDEIKILGKLKALLRKY